MTFAAPSRRRLHALVIILFRRKLWQRPYRCYPPVHRAAADNALQSKDGYAVRAILPRPEGRGLSRYLVNGPASRGEVARGRKYLDSRYAR